MAKPIIVGKVYVVGDHIDTDQIIPAQYLNLVPTIPEECERLGTHAFAGLPEHYPPFMESGAVRSEYSIVIAGRNFGCGSSREHAPVALGAAGIRAVVAESYARIFFRNVISTGEFYPCESEIIPVGAGQRSPGEHQLRNVFCTGDLAEIRLDEGRILHLGAGKAFKLKPLGAAADVVEAGGLFGFARKTGMIKSRGS